MYHLTYIIQIVHGNEDQMAVYGPVCHLQNIIWTEAKPRPIYYRLATKKNIENKKVKYNILIY
jgi:hypothetical protein